MAHMEKSTMGAASGMLRHDNRKAGEHYSRKNIDIDDTRTKLNYSLREPPVVRVKDGIFLKDIPATADSFVAYYKAYTEQNNIHTLNRKDVNVMCSWIVTKPQDVTPEEQERFFEECDKFLATRYGFKSENGSCGNILSSVVHLDETTPHIHFKFIPVTHDSKKQRDTVSAKLVVSRKDLQTFHKDLSEHMSQVFGRDIGILNGETQDVKSVAELKRRGGKIEKQLAQAETDLKIAQNEAQAILSRSEQEGKEIIHKAKDTAQRAAQNVLEGAEQKSKDIIARAEKVAQNAVESVVGGAEERADEIIKNAVESISSEEYVTNPEWRILTRKEKVESKLFQRQEVEYVQVPLEHLKELQETANKAVYINKQYGEAMQENAELRELLKEYKEQAEINVKMSELCYDVKEYLKGKGEVTAFRDWQAFEQHEPFKFDYKDISLFFKATDEQIVQGLEALKIPYRSRVDGQDGAVFFIPEKNHETAILDLSSYVSKHMTSEQKAEYEKNVKPFLIQQEKARQANTRLINNSRGMGM